MEHFGPSTINANIVFSQVDFNLGTGYEAASGSFVVPTDGVYIFHLQVMAMADYIAWLALKVSVSIFINNKMIRCTFCLVSASWSKMTSRKRNKLFDT